VKTINEETRLENLRELKRKFNAKLTEFNVLQYDHFCTLRSDIDIRRETLIHALSLNQNENPSLTHKRLDNINRQSAQMIQQVEATEKAFRLHYEKIKPLPLEDNDQEEFAIDDAEKKLSFIEKDLYRNRFEPCARTHSHNLGSLKLFNNFLTSSEDIITQVIISSNEIKILNLNTGVSQVWSMEVKCMCVYERTKLICSYYTSSCLFRDNYVIDNSIKMFDVETSKCLREFCGHTDLVTCLKVLTKSQIEVRN
jgi:hypothetical protein